MVTMILDHQLEAELLADRRASGADCHDEVWEDVHMMAPTPNLEHQALIGGWTRVLYEIVTECQLGSVFPGVNVSDRVHDWKRNYRVPDVAVFLHGTKAVRHDTFWFGGPDFAVEIVSPDDRSREKIDFYSSIQTRELLIIDRDPWLLELYRNTDRGMVLVNSLRPADEFSINSQVLPLGIRWQASDQRPHMLLEHAATKKTWTI